MPHGDRRPPVQLGSGRRLLPRWPSRREGQSRSVTWLPRGLSWWCRRCTMKTASTAPPPPSSCPKTSSCRRRRRRTSGRRKKRRGRGCMRNSGGRTPLCHARPQLGKEGRGRIRERRSFLRLLLPVGDVTVLFSDKLQQSKVYVLAVSQFQFIDDFWTFLLCSRDRYVVFLPFRSAEADPHGPDCSADH